MSTIYGFETKHLPDVASASLPTVYSSAVVALQECNKLDECKDWADKAAALASYAKQSEDDRLMNMARRIKARAIRRCGELLQEISPSKGGEPHKKRNSTRDGTVPSRTRKSAAKDAGLSERQRKDAIRVANISQEEFDNAVESDDPPTITELTKPKRQKVGEFYADDFSPASIRELIWKVELVIDHIKESDVKSRINKRDYVQRDKEKLRALLPSAINMLTNLINKEIGFDETE